LMARGVSARRSCTLLGLSRSSFVYESAPSRNEELVVRMKDLAGEQPRLGWRLAWAQLREEFAPLNKKRVRRLWRLEKLNLKPRRRGRIKGREKPDFVALWPNHAWAMDFVHDSCMNGTKFKCFAVVDECTRESIAIETACRLPSKKVIQVLEAAFDEYGVPEIIRCDNGPEFISWTFRLFLKRQGVRLVFIQPGSPWQNGFSESFNGTFRDNCLDIEAFKNLADAQIKIEAWRNFYNQSRPHSSIGYAKPCERRERFNNQNRAQLGGGVLV
jgi:putative transposase